MKQNICPSVARWRYVNTAVNIADCASRGQSVEAFMKNETCLSGPDFLSSPVEKWPEHPEGCERIMTDDPEVKKVNLLTVDKGTNHQRVDKLLLVLEEVEVCHSIVSQTQSFAVTSFTS